MSRNTKKAAWVILLMLVVSCAATYSLYRTDRLIQKKEALSTELRLTQTKLNQEQNEIVNLMVTIDSTMDKYKELESKHTQLKGDYQELLSKVSPKEANRIRQEEQQVAKEKPKEDALLATKQQANDDVVEIDESVKEVIKPTLQTLSFNGKELREGKSINLDVKFAPNSDVLTDTFEIYELSGFLKDHPTLIIKLSGHTEPNPTSSSGNFKQTSNMHLELSKRRVESVAGFLTTRGVSRTQIRTAYFGGSKPKYAIRKLNRRVELEVISR